MRHEWAEALKKDIGIKNIKTGSHLWLVDSFIKSNGKKYHTVTNGSVEKYWLAANCEVEGE